MVGSRKNILNDWRILVCLIVLFLGIGYFYDSLKKQNGTPLADEEVKVKDQEVVEDRGTKDGSLVAGNEHADNVASTFIPPVLDKALIEQYKPKPGSQYAQPVIYYVESVNDYNPEDYSEVNPNKQRSFKIMRKIGDASPELLAFISKYPPTAVLSHDKKDVLLNLMTKVQIFSITKKAFTDVFVPQSQFEVTDAQYSPDGKYIFVVESELPENGNRYVMHVVTLENGNDQIVKRGIISNDYSSEEPFVNSILGVNWHDDNTVVVMEFGGHAPYFHTLNLYTGELVMVDRAYPWDTQNKFILSKEIGDVCDDYSAVGESVYDVVDLKTNKKLGSFGDGVHRILWFRPSPNENEVVYLGAKPMADREKCGIDNKYFQYEKYFKADVATGKSIELSKAELLATLKNWNTDFVDASIECEQDTYVCSVTILDTKIFETKKSIHIFAQYYAQP